MAWAFSTEHLLISISNNSSKIMLQFQQQRTKDRYQRNKFNKKGPNIIVIRVSCKKYRRTMKATIWTTLTTETGWRIKTVQIKPLDRSMRCGHRLQASLAKEVSMGLEELENKIWAPKVLLMMILMICLMDLEELKKLTHWLRLIKRKLNKNNDSRSNKRQLLSLKTKTTTTH